MIPRQENIPPSQDLQSELQPLPSTIPKRSPAQFQSYESSRYNGLPSPLQASNSHDGDS